MTPRLPIDIESISGELGESFSVSDTLVIEQFVLGGEKLPVNAPVHVEATVMETGDCLLVTGTVSTVVTLDCSRCLEGFEHVVEAPLERCYSSEAGTDPEGDPDLEPIVESAIDLWPPISAAIAESIPFSPLCDVGCPGICPSCGATLSAGDCGCEPDVPDSPFSVLQGIFDQDEDGKDG